MDRDPSAALKHLLRSTRFRKGDRTVRLLEMVFLIILGR